MTHKTLIGWIVALAVIASLPLLPEPIGTPFHVELGSRIIVMAIFALSLQLLVGFTGLVSLGHAAFFACAAYTVSVLSPQSGPASGWWMLPAAMGASALLALAIGLLVLRTKGIYFIMVTLAFAQLVYFVLHDIPFFGGSDGTYIYFRPEFTIAGRPLLDVQDNTQFYWFGVALLGLTVLALSLVLRSRLGHALVGIKHNEQRMRAAGFRTERYKLASFVIAGAFAGIAGFLYAAQFGYVNPELASWHQSGNALVMIILGGLGSLPGAVIGAISFVLLSEWFQALTKHWQLLLGGFIILVVALMPNGLVGGISGIRRARPRPSASGADAPGPGGTPPPRTQITTAARAEGRPIGAARPRNATPEATP
ncbi:branched-chain amino acid ABC transporter permease [Verticiella sediminum]|uniref:Branched-chain amino acid ABC transporter permease n=1 Tax=Verticiella sediminum TaxID=1247510 RepID=A0A556ANP8_9BURK|nr:branched-chain amino acid ABC transporter permease [Verticiella sediminum]TSH94501.1 branched-chain amino acid ABC transporter permease [Verticiella sediminum]